MVSRIRAVREAEGMTPSAFAEHCGIKIDTLRQYEQGRRDSIGSEQLERITTGPHFEKYTLWLMTGTVAPEAGQISSEIEQACIGSPLPR